MQLHLQNIEYDKNEVYLFCRNPKTKKLEIKRDSNFSNYYYSKNDFGNFYSYKGGKASKVYGKIMPKDAKLRKDVSETDVPLTKKYILEKDLEILPSPLKYCFFDIEVLLSPDSSIKDHTAPVSCISVWDNYSKRVEQFYLGDYLEKEKDQDKAEKLLLYDFVTYIKKMQPDIMLAWHIEFDWNYLLGVLPDIGKIISPLNKDRFLSGTNNTVAPFGISIVDYLSLFKKVYMREQSYKLDSVCEKHLAGGKEFKDVDFSVLSPEIKKRNKEDVTLMAELEEKFQLLPYYDEIRRLCKVSWEDLYHNSKAIEMLCLQEAKKMHIALPNKKKHDNKVAFQGATRGLDEPGVFYRVGKYDLSAAYPSAIINFCLDETNLSNERDSKAININGNYFKQNPNTLLPLVTKKMIALKDNIGNQLKKISHNDKKYSEIKNKYAGIKGITNSVFGVIGNQYFRLYNDKVVSSITFLIRDLLTYVQDELKAKGYKVIYFDTDSVVIDNPDNIVDLLNDLIQEWGKLKYNKDSVSLNFAYEGHFKDLLILGTCHYYGNINRVGKGLVTEIKGIEMKRASSTVFEAAFQEELIKKVLNGDSKDNIEKWIITKKADLKTTPISDIAFPAKVSLDKVYKYTPIFMRAIANTQLFDPSFKIKGADLFHYIYIEKQGKDPNNKNIDVIAFKNEDDSILELYKDKINWSEMERRNIDSKVEKIFEALKWNTVAPPPEEESGLMAFIDEEIKEVRKEKKELSQDIF